MGPPTDPQTVRTLIGHKQLAVGLRCLPTLSRLSADPLRLVVHDDGSLTADDVDALRGSLGQVPVVTRAEADDRVGPLLRKHPSCAAYRRDHPLGLKLLDGPLIGNGDWAFCDSDVLFVRRFAGLFRWPSPAAGCLLIRDAREAYAVRPWHVFPFTRVRPVSRGNTGVFFLRAGKFDLDHVEYLLTRDRFRPVFVRRPYWIEQTCLAAVAGRAGAWWYDPEQLVLANRGMTRVTPATVGIHFIGTVRDELDRFHPPGADDPAVAIRTRPAPFAGPLRLLVSDIGKFS